MISGYAPVDSAMISACLVFAAAHRVPADVAGMRDPVLNALDLEWPILDVLHHLRRCCRGTTAHGTDRPSPGPRFTDAQLAYADAIREEADLSRARPDAGLTCSGQLPQRGGGGRCPPPRLRSAAWAWPPRRASWGPPRATRSRSPTPGATPSG